MTDSRMNFHDNAPKIPPRILCIGMPVRDLTFRVSGVPARGSKENATHYEEICGGNALNAAIGIVRLAAGIGVRHAQGAENIDFDGLHRLGLGRRQMIEADQMEHAVYHEMLQRNFALGLAAILGAMLVAYSANLVPTGLVISVLTAFVAVGLVALAVYLVLLYAANIFAGLALGGWIIARTSSGQATPHRIWAMILGVVVLSLVGLIPILGGLIVLLALFAGLGGFLLSWWRERQSPQPAVS